MLWAGVFGRNSLLQFQDGVPTDLKTTSRARTEAIRQVRDFLKFGSKVVLSLQTFVGFGDAKSVGDRLCLSTCSPVSLLWELRACG